MSFVAQLAEKLQAFDRRTWPTHRVPLSEEMKAILARDRVVVADVGAAAGPEARWLELSDYIHFLTFEPVTREGGSGSGFQSTNFAVGLGAERRRATLHLMKDVDATTLCEPNLEKLDDFVIGDGLRETGRMEIELDTLDHCVAARPELRPHFLKVDVEGADLDVLRGATGVLAETVLGVRIEMSFLERHKGAPFFGETDVFLRERGFQLFQLSHERWIRRNGLYGFTSEPQLAWGDAVYFLTREKFLARLRVLAKREERAALVTKFAFILLSFGGHDYALELVEAAEREKLLEAGAAGDLREAVRGAIDYCPLYLAKSFLGVLFAAGIWVASLPMAGARQRAKFYVKQRAGRFFYLMWRLNTRNGPDGSCISE